jgi:hypothetical protein
MKNIFEKFNLRYYYFGDLLKDTNLEWDLYNYLHENLTEEIKNLLDVNLENSLTTNANGEYF